jgi:uncharacterized protein involved in response to NO
MTIAAASVLATRPGCIQVSAAAMIIAAVLAAARLVRWRLWALRGRPDLLCVASGYGWLAAGLF